MCTRAIPHRIAEQSRLHLAKGATPTPSFFITVCPPMPAKLYLNRSKFQTICKVSATASHSGLGGPTNSPRAYFPHPSSLPPSLSPFSLELLEMPPESSFSNRISRICPSLSEIGGQKPQERSCVIFLLSTWQFFSNIHPDMSEGSE